MELDMGSITNRRNTTSACPSWNHAKVKHKNLKFCYEKAHTSVKGENDRPAPTIAGQRVTLDQARSRGVPRITRDHIRTAAICKVPFLFTPKTHTPAGVQADRFKGSLESLTSIHLNSPAKLNFHNKTHAP
ncbi:unnamed protein product [Fusarium graminearum]|nr:unnamed protein product [Fusarium graminearum]